MLAFLIAHSRSPAFMRTRRYTDRRRRSPNTKSLSPNKSLSTTKAAAIQCHLSPLRQGKRDKMARVVYLKTGKIRRKDNRITVYPRRTRGIQPWNQTPLRPTRRKRTALPRASLPRLLAPPRHNLTTAPLPPTRTMSPCCLLRPPTSDRSHTAYP